MEPETARRRPKVSDMKYALAAALMLLSSAVFAATPEETYIAERDAFIAKLNPPGDMVAPTDAATKEMELARAVLAKRLLGVIGPVNVRGFSGTSEYSVGSLFRGDMEFGVLDALVFTNKQTRLVVTTTDLADRWFKSRDGLSPEDGTSMPKDLQSALKRDEFYTRATPGDAAVGNMGELPVTKPAGVDFAYAMLALRRQDIVPVPADEMLIGVIVPPRLYILNAPIAKIKIMPACEKLSRDADAKANRMARSKDDKVSNAAEGVREQGDEAMRKCFAEQVKSNPAFTKLTKQAQDFVDMLAAK